MTPTPPELRSVKRAAANRATAEAAYRDALIAARKAGISAAAIGEAAGVSRQAVLKMTADAMTPTGWDD